MLCLLSGLDTEPCLLSKHNHRSCFFIACKKLCTLKVSRQYYTAIKCIKLHQQALRQFNECVWIWRLRVPVCTHRLLPIDASYCQM
jgi:hypothetical protein